MKVDVMDLSLSNSSPMVATADHDRQGQAARALPSNHIQ